MVPDCYRNRLKIWNGDPKVLLPRVIDSVEIIDVFYHGSNQPYQRMMFEFEEVKRKLAQGGLIVAVDVGWNASLWDFAEKFGVPSYTFKAGVGVAFF